ncbi:hypothetical protein Tco_1011480 [Tanacetum coccineum]
MPWKTRSLTIVEETVVGSKVGRLKSLRQKKQAVTGEGSSVAHKKFYDSSDTDSDATLYTSSSDKTEESENETDDDDESDMDLSVDNPYRDDDAAGYGEFMHNKPTATPNSTYLSLTVTSSSLDFVQTLLDETPTNKLMDFMSHPVYTDAQTTSVVHNPKGNPELTSYISGASKVSLENSLSCTTSPTKLTLSQSKEADSKGKEKYEEVQLQEGTVQAKVLTEIKKLLPTHIQKAVANYVRPCLDTFVLDVMKNNHFNLFTQSSTSTDDLSDMDLKLNLLNRIHSNKSNETHTTHQQLYDILYESITLDQDALDAQAAQLSFHKRSSRQNRSPMIIIQDDTLVMQPLDQADILIQKHSNPEWFPKKSGLAKRRTTWFDLLLKSDIDKNENHILGHLLSL